MLLFLFLVHIYSYTSYIGYVDDRLNLVNTNNAVIISDSIFQSFHNTKSEVGGAIYIDNERFSIEFNTLGFADCTTTDANCGAFYLNCYSMSISHICGNFCEAIHGTNQLFGAMSGILSVENHINYMTVSFCGTKDRGISAFTINGSSKFILTNINSSYNINKYGSKAYGTCFRTNNVNSFEISYFNFLHSTGLDVCNTHYSPDGKFEFGNFHNCSTTFVFKYRGPNIISHCFFSMIIRENMFFYIGASSVPSSLNLSNCHFDVKPLPVTDYDSHVTLDSSNSEDNPFNTFQIDNQEKLDNCPVPTNFFTQSVLFSASEAFSQSNGFFPTDHFSPSEKFTLTNKFSPSNLFSKSVVFSPSSLFTKSSLFLPSSFFTKSKHFSPSEKFTMSNKFSPSTQFSKSEKFSPSSFFTSSKKFSSSLFFSRSITFSPSKKFTLSSIFSKSSEFTFSDQFSPSFIKNITSPFTQSSPFTPSFTFSPNATKYPDGIFINRPNNKGLNKQASPMAIGATAGISIILIVVSVILMILYLGNKRKQLQEKLDNLSDSFLCDSTVSDSSSYSYSYYSYDYTYTYVMESQYSYSDNADQLNYKSYTDESYSDFNGTYVSFDNLS